MPASPNNRVRIPSRKTLAQTVEAAAAMPDDGELPDVIVADVRMPGLSGLELLERVHRRRPELPVMARAETRRVEEALCAGNTALTEAVARNYARVLAYKDEYEVARLHSATTFVTDLRKRFGIPAPEIVVCGLNPHAGEGGHLGQD